VEGVRSSFFTKMLTNGYFSTFGSMIFEKGEGIPRVLGKDENKTMEI
jgi:hypothetical protein